MIIHNPSVFPDTLKNYQNQNTGPLLSQPKLKVNKSSFRIDCLNGMSTTPSAINIKRGLNQDSQAFTASQEQNSSQETVTRGHKQNPPL